MTSTQKIAVRIPVLLILLTTLSTTGSGQSGVAADAIGGPLTSWPVVGAPFSAEATANFSYPISDARRHQVRTTARYYRDSTGRVRIEQAIADRSPTTSSTLIVIADGHQIVTVDPSERAIRRVPGDVFARLFDGVSQFSVPLTPTRFLTYHMQDPCTAGWDAPGTGFGTPSGRVVSNEALGSSRIEGIEVAGRRVTTQATVGEVGNDAPLEIVDERWESSALKLVVYARSSDPRAGILEYRLTNISRAEPPSDLFIVPGDYTLRGLTADDPAASFEPWQHLAKPSVKQRCNGALR